MAGRDYLLGSVNEGFTYERGDDWRDAALCAQVDPELHFPDTGGNARPAKKVCNGDKDNAPCPVKAQCLADALAKSEPFGILGGLTVRERQRLRTRLAAAESAA